MIAPELLTPLEQAEYWENKFNQAREEINRIRAVCNEQDTWVTRAWNEGFDAGSNVSDEVNGHTVALEKAKNPYRELEVVRDETGEPEEEVWKPLGYTASGPGILPF